MKKLLVSSDFIPETAAIMPLISRSEQYTVSAVISSAGRIPPETSWRKALDEVRKCGLNCPVFMGTDEAMVADIDPMRKMTAPVSMVKTGIRYGLENDIELWDQAAVVQIILFFKEVQEPVTVLCLGPMTDLALAIRICPSICRKIERLIIAAGCDRSTSASSAAEYNVRHDPEAAAVILACQTEKLLIPEDCADIFCDRINCECSSAAEGLAAMVKQLNNGSALSEKLLAHRLLAVLVLENEKALQDIRPWSVYVDISGGLAYGQTVFDTRHIFDDFNCRSGFTPDFEKCFELLNGLCRKR